MNKKIENLLNLIKENPDLEIITMVSYEVVAGDDYCYWLGSIGDSDVIDVYFGEEKIYLDKDELITKYMDENCDSPLTNEELEKQAEEVVRNYDWKKVIVVYIELP